MKNPWNRPDDFLPAEVQVGAGIGRNLYDQWLFRGLIKAEHPARGAGTYSRFTFKNIVQGALLVELKKYDIRLKICAELAWQIADYIEDKEEWPVVYLSWSVEGIKFYTEETLQDQPSCLHLDVYVILNSACGRIEEMAPEK